MTLKRYNNTKKNSKNTKNTKNTKKNLKIYKKNKSIKGGQSPGSQMISSMNQGNQPSFEMPNNNNNNNAVKREMASLGLNNINSNNTPTASNNTQQTPSNNTTQQEPYNNTTQQEPYNNVNTKTSSPSNNVKNDTDFIVTEDPMKDLTYYEGLPDSEKFAIANREGYYLVGLDIGSFIQYVSTIFDKIIDKTEIDEKDINTVKQFGEYVDQDYEQIIADVEGLRDMEINRPLLPEKYLGERATLNNIVTESKKYSLSSKITAKGLFKLCNILSKYKQTYAQWFRLASLLEIIFQYSDVKQTRTDFFTNSFPLSIGYLREVEEFWKTEHIFSTSKQMDEFKQQLDFYKDKTSTKKLSKMAKLMDKYKNQASNNNQNSNNNQASNNK
jgi:hypothetical protein